MAKQKSKAEQSGSGKANRVLHTAACHWGDRYEGRKNALIEAGVAKAEWFPTVQPKDKYGRTKRTFEFSDGDRDIRMRDRNGIGYWSLSIRLTGEALERRQREMEAKEPQAEVQAEGGEETERASDPLSDREAGLIVKVRRLSDHRRAKCCDLIDRFLSDLAKPARLHPHLTVVVDNDK